MKCLHFQVLLEIFSYLSYAEKMEASLTCRRWFDAIEDHLGKSRRVAFRGLDSLTDTEEPMLSLLKMPRKFRAVTIDNVKVVKGERFWQTFSDQIEDLEIVTERRNPLLFEPLRYLTKLEGLNLRVKHPDIKISRKKFICRRGPPRVPISLTQEEKQFCRDSLQKLKHLSLQNFSVDNFLSFLTELGPNNLESLLFNECELGFYFTSAGSSIFRDLITRSAGSLKILNFNIRQLKENDLKVLCRTPDLRLKELHIPNCQEISDETIRALLETQIDLQVLDLSNCTHLKEENLIFLARNLMRLKTLRLLSYGNTVTNQSLTELRNLSNLNRLEINDSLIGINQSSIVALVTSCTNLTVLKLQFSIGFDSDKAVQALFAHATQLRELYLDYSYYITDAVLMGYNQEEDTPAPRPSKRICIDHDTTSRSIANLKRLTVLSLRRCNFVTDHSLFNCFKFQELRSLNISFCDKVS